MASQPIVAVLQHGRGLVEQGGNLFGLPSGKHQRYPCSLEQIRQVAGDLNEYFDFGHKLSNYIATNIHHAALEKVCLRFPQIPALPPLPVHLNTAQRKK
jgi:hypothetical protein